MRDPRSEAALEHSEDRTLVQSGLRSLSRRERRIVALRFYRDLSHQRIADEVGLSQVQVSRVLTASLVKLRHTVSRGARAGTGMSRRVVVRPREHAYTLRGVSVQPSAADVDDERLAKAPLPSRRLLLRMPPDLHAELTQAAEREGSSLNGYITASLRESVGRDVDGAHRRAADGSSTATLTRVLLLNAPAVTVAAVVAVAILLVALLG